MKTSSLRADSLLMLAAAIWGFAFVAQRAGMEHIGPFLFNGVRFGLGCLSLLPLLLWNAKHKSNPGKSFIANKKIAVYGLVIGLVLFVGSSLQQAGLVYTSAGKAGFITGLYVILVPVMGLLWQQRIHVGAWVGAVLATAGLYFLSVTEQFTIEKGDLLVLLSAIFWAAHVHIIGWLAQKIDAILVAFMQFAVCSVLSLLTAFLLEPISVDGLLGATVPILYGGLFSAGIAYTLQVIAQKDAHPAHAAIILSLEGVFAVIGGWLLLAEVLTTRVFAGCALMLSGMIFSQMHILLRKRKKFQ